MAKYQVWLGGNSLMDIPQGVAKDKKEALKWAREWLEVKRLPKGTCVCEISDDYYDGIVKNNQAIGTTFEAS